MRRISLPTRGVSLIEALVAMAVMAFGMLALVGVQSTLRENADLAKQRTEATRLAERAVEQVRNFTTVGSGGGTNAEYDAVNVAAATVNDPDSNATYTVGGAVTTMDDRQRQVEVNVTWVDRRGNTQQVTLRDIIARADPILGGLLSVPRTVTPVGRRQGRHPTIPVRAHDLGSESIFKPNESGTVAWVFNNSTGAITHVCTVSAVSTSATLTSGDVTSSCTILSTSAQLLSGEIRFNLRGAPVDQGNGNSVMKPVSGGDVAWVIQQSNSTVIRVCPVSPASTSATLTPANVLLGCLATNVPISPFAANDSTYTLVASDSENPIWPALPVTVTLSSLSGVSSQMCISTADTSSLAIATVTPPLTSVEYFCIINPSSTSGWSGHADLLPVAYSNGNAAVWSIGTGTGNYQVCRYTTASTNYTDNADHPKDYSKWSATCGTPSNPACRPVTGNLVNQNYLVIDGTKSCPTDGAANPASGDLVNSNTLPHQP